MIPLLQSVDAVAVGVWQCPFWNKEATYTQIKKGIFLS